MTHHEAPRSFKIRVRALRLLPSFKIRVRASALCKASTILTTKIFTCFVLCPIYQEYFPPLHLTKQFPLKMANITALDSTEIYYYGVEMLLYSKHWQESREAPLLPAFNKIHI